MKLKTEVFNSDGQFAIMDEAGDDRFYSVFSPEKEPHPNHDGEALAALANEIVNRFNSFEALAAEAQRLTNLLVAMRKSVDHYYDTNITIPTGGNGRDDRPPTGDDFNELLRLIPSYDEIGSK